MGARAFGAPEDGTQIVGVGQLVADDDQGRFPTGRGFLQNVVNGKIGVGGGQSDHALMGMGEGHGVQLPPERFLKGVAPFQLPLSLLRRRCLWGSGREIPPLGAALFVHKSKILS